MNRKLPTSYFFIRNPEKKIMLVTEICHRGQKEALTSC